MSGFEDIRLRAEARKGGARALKAMLPTVATKKQLIELGDDRYLAMMTKSINQAGFSWKVIENKWPSFEEAFLGFDPRKLSYLSPEQWEAFTSDKRVVRNWQKIKALQDNVFFVQDESRRSGGFGQFIADWPVEDQIGLMAYLKKHGSRLGGQRGSTRSEPCALALLAGNTQPKPRLPPRSCAPIIRSPRLFLVGLSPRRRSSHCV